MPNYFSSGMGPRVAVGGGRPLIQGPLISKQKRNQIKQGVNKFTGGVKDLFTKDPLKNKYYSNDELIDEANADAAAKGQGGGDGAGGGKKDGGSGTSMLGPGLAMGSAALDALDDDPGYGGMDVGKEALKFAAMGAAAGPIGAGVGAVVGAGIGLIKKNKYEKEEREKNIRERKERSNKADQIAARQSSDSFYAGQSAANQAAYTGEDIDMFINKYAQ